MRLTPEVANRLMSVFPNKPWKRIACSSPRADVPNGAGNYAFLLPQSHFGAASQITLIGPKRRPIPFEFAPELHKSFGDLMVVYVGKTTNLAKRFTGHFAGGDRRPVNQVLCGLLDCAGAASIDDALRVTKAIGSIVYCELPGDENVANRDLLEHLMCGRLAPPFNIKSER